MIPAPNEKTILQKISQSLLDEGGKNEGCVVEPDTFRKRIALMDDKHLREVLETLDSYLYRTRKLWESDYSVRI